MPREKATEPRLVFQIKINLLGSKPLVWRRVLIPTDFTLEELHWVIQAAMPWTNSHLHQFIDENEKRYSDPRFQLEDVSDEKRTPVSELLRKPKDWILYEYDFGDGWEHSVELEKVIEAEAKQKLPACVAGKRAAPPEDCGGIGGYAHLLDVLKDEEHEEYDDMIEWLGGAFDPAAFDPADFERSARRLHLR